MTRTLLILSLVLASSVAHAELREVHQTIYGMDWATCARAVSAAMKRLDGVTDVAVDLNSGVADIKLGPDNRTTLAEIDAAVRKNGFLPKNAEILAKGRLIAQGDKSVFLVSGTGEQFSVASESAAARDKTGKELSLRGSVATPVKSAGEQLRIDHLE